MNCLRGHHQRWDRSPKNREKTIDLFILAIIKSTPNFFFSRPNAVVYVF